MRDTCTRTRTRLVALCVPWLDGTVIFVTFHCAEQRAWLRLCAQIYGSPNAATGATGGYLGYTAASKAVPATGPGSLWGCTNKCTQFSDTKRIVDTALAARVAPIWTAITTWTQLNAMALELYGCVRVNST